MFEWETEDERTNERTGIPECSNPNHLNHFLSWESFCDFQRENIVSENVKAHDINIQCERPTHRSTDQPNERPNDGSETREKKISENIDNTQCENIISLISMTEKKKIEWNRVKEK